MNNSRPLLQTGFDKTQQFLRSKTPVPAAVRQSRPDGKNDSDPLLKSYPQVLSNDALVTHGLSRLESSPNFSAMVLELDALDNPEKEGADKDLNGTRQYVARAIDTICEQYNGVWGIFDSLSFGCFLPESNKETCLNIAKSFKQILAEYCNRTVTVGIAVFPTLDFKRDQTLENARKALEHAKFFGPDSLVPFDAISLNISADKLYDDGHIRRAIAEFQKALMLDGSDANIHNSLGVCYGVMGDFQAALSAFKKAIKLNSGENLALYNAGLAHMLMGNRQKALEHFIEADNQTGNQFEVAVQIGRLYLEMDAPEKSRSYLERAAALRPDTSVAYAGLGECFTAMNMPRDAIDAYKKAIRLNANDAVSLSGLGWLYNAQGKNPEIATLLCKQSVEIAPDNGMFRHRLGRIYLSEDRLQEALDQFEKADQLGYNSSEYIERVRRSMNEISS
jgi:tetratricopeptide (TPR) repeat protein